MNVFKGSMAGLGEANGSTHILSLSLLSSFSPFSFPYLRDLVGKRHKQARGEEGRVKFHVRCFGGGLEGGWKLIPKVATCVVNRVVDFVGLIGWVYTFSPLLRWCHCDE